MGTMRPALPLTGGCSCGAIRYRIASWPLAAIWQAGWPEFFPQK
jgi:hypothetical protein